MISMNGLLSDSSRTAEEVKAGLQTKEIYF